MESLTALWKRIAEPKASVPPERQLFTNQDLRALIAPLFVEQLLAMLVGIADTNYLSNGGDPLEYGDILENKLNC